MQEAGDYLTLVTLSMPPKCSVIFGFLKFLYNPSTTQVTCGEQYSPTVAMASQILGMSAPLCHISQWSIVPPQSAVHSKPAMVLPSIIRKPETCCELWFQCTITLQWRNDIYQHHKRRKKWFWVISAKSLPMISVFLASISFDWVFAIEIAVLLIEFRCIHCDSKW